jgi:hypothetical protein
MVAWAVNEVVTGFVLCVVVVRARCRRRDKPQKAERRQLNLNIKHSLCSACARRRIYAMSGSRRRGNCDLRARNYAFCHLPAHTKKQQRAFFLSAARRKTTISGRRGRRSAS